MATSARRPPVPAREWPANWPSWSAHEATIQAVSHGLDLLIWAVRGMKLRQPTPEDLDVLLAELSDLSSSLWWGGARKELGPWLVDPNEAGSIAEIVGRRAVEQKAAS